MSADAVESPSVTRGRGAVVAARSVGAGTSMGGGWSGVASAFGSAATEDSFFGCGDCDDSVGGDAGPSSPRRDALNVFPHDAHRTVSPAAETVRGLSQRG